MDFSDGKKEKVLKKTTMMMMKKRHPRFRPRELKRIRISVVVTEILLNKNRNAQEGSTLVLKKLLSIRAACHSANDKDNDDEDNVDQSASTFIIPSPEIYQFVMIATENALSSCDVQASRSGKELLNRKFE
jgi:hypothetical protein